MLDLVKRLGEQGLAVVIVSHNLADVFEVANRITVLRLGRNVGVYEREKTTEQEIVQAITAGTGHGAGSVVSTAAPAEVQAAAAGDSLGADTARALGGAEGRRRRQPAGDRRDHRDHRVLHDEDARSSSPRSTSSNLIGQMAGVTVIAIGIVFVLLIGEIDLSVGYVSGLASVTVAEMQLPGSSHHYPGLVAIALRGAASARRSGSSRGRSSPSSACRRSSSRWRGS